MLLGAIAPAAAGSIAMAAQPLAQKFTNAANQISSIRGIAQSNNAASAEQASILRDWQVQQNAKAMQFNAAEAAKNRNWQEYMSNTAHQREVRDLMAAGLNPVLSAMNGNGAAVTSGATASGVTSSGAHGDVDTSTSGAIANLLGSVLSANTAIQAANINARTQEAVADKYTAMEKIVADINAAVGAYSADQHLKGAYASAGATQYAANQSASASRYASDNARAASKYSSDMSYKTTKDFPSNGWRAGGSALQAIGNVLETNGNSSGKAVADVIKGRKSLGQVIVDDPTWDTSLLGKFVNKHFRNK